MKKPLILSAVCFVACLLHGRVTAQTVTIPDANFATYLNTIIPSAMSGNQMNTASAAVTSLTRIDVENLGIADLTGVQYFTSLQTLDCGNGSTSVNPNTLTSLPALPSTLDSLICGNNQLTSLPTLPSGLLLLKCYTNQLTSLPALPSELTYLDCNNNQLTSMPVLPTTLEWLYCSNNQLTSLPTLPGSLLELDCDQNDLTSLPAIPSLLQLLYCGYNQLTNLPSLPATLWYLECNYNQLTGLPSLPEALQTLYCENNQLTSLPSSLPGALTSLSCDANQLAILPTLPGALQNLTCSDNQLTSLPALPDALLWIDCVYNQLTSLPALPGALLQLECNDNQLTSLPALPETLQQLACYNNQLTSLPALPAVLNQLLCYSNQLTSLPALPDALGWLDCNTNNISCFPVFPNSIKIGGYLDIFNNPFTCLPNYIPAMDPGTLAYPLCVPGNPNGCTSAQGIVGYAYDDMNGDCIKDAGDKPLVDIPVQLYDNSNNLLSQTYTAINGVYDFPEATAGTYVVKVDTTNMPYMVQCAYPGADSTLVLTSLDTAVNFSLTCKPSFDVGVEAVVEKGLVFPGVQHHLHVIAGDISHRYNLDCASGVSGTVQITVSGPVTYAGIGAGALTPSIAGDVYTYTIPDYGLVNNLTAFNLLFTTDISAQAGDNVCVNVNVTPTAGDNDTLNNTYQYCYSVVNSHDPNSKEVYPVNVPPGYTGWLTYTVHFQNTGSAAANNIMLADTLDNKLDLSTFQILSYSNQNTASLTGNVLTVRFNNINLPDSTANPTGSIGYVQYRIKPKANEPYGASIKNTAYVYFDYNAAVITDTTHNAFNVTASVDNITIDNSSIHIFPNPSTGIVNGKLSMVNENNHLEVYNVLGEQIEQSTIYNSQFTIDLSAQPDGVYMYRVLTQAGNLVGEGKLIIQK